MITAKDAVERLNLIRCLNIVGFASDARNEADRLHIEALAVPLEHPDAITILSTALKTVEITGL